MTPFTPEARQDMTRIVTEVRLARMRVSLDFLRNTLLPSRYEILSAVPPTPEHIRLGLVEFVIASPTLSPAPSLHDLPLVDVIIGPGGSRVVQAENP